MLGAIIGDIVGSRFEGHNHKSKDFDLFHPDCSLTDDSIMTLAIAKAISECGNDYDKLFFASINSSIMHNCFPSHRVGNFAN